MVRLAMVPTAASLIDTGGHGEIEITVFEDGVPPRFRLFFFEQGNHAAAVLAAEQTVTLETVRPDASRQTFEFKPPVTGGSYLESTTEIPEPHEFTAYVQVGHGGHAHTYKTEFSEEGHQHDHADGHSHGGTPTARTTRIRRNTRTPTPARTPPIWNGVSLDAR